MTDEKLLPPDIDTTPLPEDMPEATDDKQVPGPLSHPDEPAPDVLDGALTAEAVEDPG